MRSLARSVSVPISVSRIPIALSAASIPGVALWLSSARAISTAAPTSTSVSSPTTWFLVLVARLRFAVKRVIGVEGNLHSNSPLNLSQEALALLVAKRDGSSFGSGSCGASYTMHVGVRFVGKVKVDDEIDAFHIDSSGGNIGRHEDFDLAAAKLLQGAHAGALRFVSMDSSCRHPRLGEVFCDPVCDVFHARKHEGEPVGPFRQQLGKELSLVAAGDVAEPLVDLLHGGRRRRDLDMLGVSQDRSGQLDDGIGHRRGKEQ